jgi:hypothetical protein
MHVPICKESLLDTQYCSILPFFKRGVFRPPFALSSKAPFASSDLFCFIRISDEPRLVDGDGKVKDVQRLSYGNNMN